MKPSDTKRDAHWSRHILSPVRDPIQRKKPLVLGITGGMGSGKSTVSAMLQEKGVKLIDGDVIAKELVEKPDVLEELVSAFGSDILDGNGHLLRKQLARIAFGDPENIMRLNDIMHKKIASEIKKRVSVLGDDIGLVDVALPVREGFLDTCQEIWCVIAKKESRMIRIQQRDGLLLPQIQDRIRNQPTDEVYLACADKTIVNDGGFSELKQKATMLWNEFINHWRTGG
jgi:dephospho-CoA kinase